MSDNTDMTRRLALMAKYPRRLDMVELRSIRIPRSGERIATEVANLDYAGRSLITTKTTEQPQK
jgi:hypothetical protein